jgi:hypothetical protein
MLVHVQKELIVRAHIDVEMWRRKLKLDHLSEVQYDLISRGGIRSGNPLRGPSRGPAISRDLCSMGFEKKAESEKNKRLV